MNYNDEGNSKGRGKGRDDSHTRRDQGSMTKQEKSRLESYMERYEDISNEEDSNEEECINTTRNYYIEYFNNMKIKDKQQCNMFSHQNNIAPSTR